MPRKTSIYLQLLTYGILIGASCALIGHAVKYAAPHEYPYVVSISEKAWILKSGMRYQICTGSLINKRSVLTAAHCIINRRVDDIEILAGNQSLKYSHIHKPERWITYDEWKYGEKDKPSLSDIAIIILQGEGVHDQHNFAVKVSPFDPDSYFNNKVTIIGWGTTITGRTPTSVKKGVLRIISNEECNRRGSIVRGESAYSVPPNYFCTAVDPWILTSHGDGGAPVINAEHELIGINIGTVPPVEGRWNDDNIERFRQIQVNTHLRLRYYREFIRTVQRHFT